VITYAVSGISGIWWLKPGGVPLVTVVILVSTAVVGLLDLVTALLVVRRV
jgi:hypothetical protein